MKKISAFILFCSTFLFAHYLFAANPTSPIGYWQTIDDVTNQPKSIIQITETPAHIVEGTVIKIFPRPGYDQNELCTACNGSQHNQRIVGMKILTGLQVDKDNPDRWNGGEILDPHNGKTYHSTMQLTDNNQKLNVRGYIGVPLFGRSQSWQRVESVE